MRRACLLFALVSLFTTPCLASQSLPEVVTQALESKWVVAIGENHGHVELHEALIELMADPGVQAVVDDWVVEFGNGFYQEVVDRYIRGDEVPQASVRLAWRNAVISPNTVWDSPVYERFFQAIREVNRERRDGRQYRVVLGDSAVDWTTIHSREDLRPFFGRSQAMVDAVTNEVLKQGRKAVLVAGGAHLTRRNMVRMSRHGVPRAEVSVVSRLALHYPGTLFVIRSLGRGPQTLSLDAEPGSVMPTSDSRLRAIPANTVSSMRNRDGSPFDAYGDATLEQLVDAVIYWGPEADNHFAEPNPSTYRDETYWRELNHRSLLLRGQAMDPALRQGG